MQSQQDRSKETLRWESRSCGTAIICSEEANKYTNVWLEHRVQPSLVYTTQVEHHKECASGYTWSYSAYKVLPQIDDEQCHNRTHLQLENGYNWLHGPVD